MLKSLQKFFTAQAETSASAEHNEEVTKMTEEKDQAITLATDNTAVVELTANLASVTEAFATLQSQYAEAVAALAEVEVAKTALVADAKAVQMAARKEKMEATIGTEKAPAVLASLESLDDATFATVVGAMASSFETESKSEMFTEAGVSAEAEVEVKPVHFNKFIKKN